MYSEYHDIKLLEQAILHDKEATGMDVYTRDRYPIRFVLFDNFKDCSHFVDFVTDEIGALVQSVDKWIDTDYPDLMLTHTELARRITEFIKGMKGDDCLIAPFSEMARFYDNDTEKTFDALLKTVKGIEASRDALKRHQRVYIPIVGLEGKMDAFVNDSQSTIWRLFASDRDLTYRLILSDQKTYGIKNLEQHFTLVNTMLEWLNIWKDPDKLKSRDIICTSHAIYSNAQFAQPDNAFTFVKCSSAYDFLADGLRLPFGGLTQNEGDGNNWEVLAEHIDVSHDFSFKRFVLEYFMVGKIDDTQNFVRLWFEHPSSFDRWLLARYYVTNKADKPDYICKILSKTSVLTGNDFVEQAVLYMTEIKSEMVERHYTLTEAIKHHAILREGTQIVFAKRMEAIANKYGPTSALRYFTGISDKEKELSILWLSKGWVNYDQVKPFFTDLYTYQSEPVGISFGVPKWLPNYMKAYKTAKISNQYNTDVAQEIDTLNGSEVAFDGWYQDFSTVRTLLQSRNDIDVYYWVDGLGIEWIPLIKQIIAEHKSVGIYLNEVKIARALLPTITSINKADLQKLLPETEVLQKSGDLDSFAHRASNVWPNSLIEEIALVRSIIEDIMQKYAGKKIAIVSDHGLTYLSQLCDGLGMAGVEPDHHGRCAKRKVGEWTQDSHYFRLDDKETACALTHRSICNKVPKGQGAHGGCTPEEVLVPIFILSAFSEGAAWTAELLSYEISGTDSRVRFRIKNLSSIEIPFVEYGGKRYKMTLEDKDVFISDSLALIDDQTDVTLVIGNVSRNYKISIETGVKEEDLFADF